MLQTTKRILQKSILYQDFRTNHTAQICSLILFIALIFALCAPWLAQMNPYDLQQIDIMNSELPPVWIDGADERFIFGTDPQGRDLYSTILYGTRISLMIGFFSVLLQMFLGILIGLLAGFYGGKIDSFFMRLADIQLSFSTLMVAIIVLAIFQATFGTELYHRLAMLMLILVIGISEWPQYARTIRASVLSEKKKEYIDATHVIGFNTLRILFRHILPNTLSPILIISTVQVANAIISEASLSFLGLGMPANKPSLGSLISIGFHHLLSGSWWITVIPGVVLIVLVLVINLLGDWLRDVLNPKLYRN